MFQSLIEADGGTASMGGGGEDDDVFVCGRR